MLPGFRFLLLTIVLAVSMMIFGLGAVSLLRSAHQQFANLPTRLTTPETTFAQVAEPPSRLAMLSVEARTSDNEVGRADAQTSSGTPPETSQQVALVATDKTTDQQAAVVPTTEAVPATDPPPAPATSPEVHPADTVAMIPEPEAASALSNAGISSDTTGSVAPPAMADMESPGISDISTRIATLGGPPVDIFPIPLPVAKPVITTTRAARKRTINRRRIAARETTAAAPRSADPFATTTAVR